MFITVVLPQETDKTPISGKYFFNILILKLMLEKNMNNLNSKCIPTDVLNFCASSKYLIFIILKYFKL